MDGMDDLLAEFVTDTQEALEQVDIRLVELENESNGTAMLNELFRLMHTIKGTCGFLGLPRMAGLAHAAENLMDRLRNGEPVTHDAIDAMLRVVDALKSLLAHIETSGGQEPEGSDDALIAALNEAGNETLADAEASAGGGGAAEAPHEDGVQRSPEGPDGDDGARERVGGMAVAGAKSDDERAVKGERDGDGDGKREAAGPRPVGGPSVRPPAPPVPGKAANDVAPARAAAHGQAAGAPRSEAREDKQEASAEANIRVSVETLEHLMTVVSELVLTRNEITEVMRNEERSSHKLALQRLSTVTGELQQAVMSTRMQPIGNAWRKLPRIVRDVSTSLGKQIELEMAGANTELDRQVLESIKDPLMHMVRNAADHGLETPQERARAGKPEKGRISLNAYHEGGQILVEIGDDGRGLDVERIKSKAIERGITSPEEAERLSDDQVFSFIFEPGFSTAAKVTSVSGRGVGMDVVQSNVERIGGSIDVRSVKGKGSVFTLKIPLTLAILRALIVGVETETFAIPQTSVDELVKVEPNGPHSIQLIKDAPVLRSRDRLLPVVDLRSVLDLSGGAGEGSCPRTADESAEGFVMVMRARGMRFGMLVDSVARTEEIVVKPMPAALRGIEIFSGSTILGDGRVIMIVDPNGVRSAASSPSEAALSTMTAQAEAEPDTLEPKQLLLMFHAHSRNRKALPISLITRLEEICLADADQSDGQWHIQYNNELIPLVWFGEAPEPGSNARKPLLVMSDAGRSMGLLVDEIVDIVEDKVEVQIPSEVDGILGSAIIGGAAAEVIDVSYFLGLASAHWFDPGLKAGPGADQILLVDDSVFFRNLVAPVVRSGGFEPVVFSSGADALEWLEHGATPAVIVTDVDMPEMDGFAFAKACKRIERLRHVPILALTGMITDDAIARARAGGFSDYISKLDRNGLLQSLREFTKPVTEEVAA